jgi:hypothetical protein
MQRTIKDVLVYGRIVLDVALIAFFWKMTSDADNSGVPDAGLIGLVTLPIMLALLIDSGALFWLNRRSKKPRPTRKPFFLALYYSVTAMLLVYGICRYFWIDRPIAASWAAVAGVLFAAIFYRLGMLQRRPAI